MNINTDIARTYLFSGKKMTAVAVLGVLLGMSIYIFMNSLLVGFDKASDENIFKKSEKNPQVPRWLAVTGSDKRNWVVKKVKDP